MKTEEELGELTNLQLKVELLKAINYLNAVEKEFKLSETAIKEGFEKRK